MSNDTEWSNTLLADRAWRRRHSAWLLAVILGAGLLSFIGFVYCAMRIQSRRWWLIALCASLASAAMWAVTSIQDESGEITDWATAVGMAIWAVMIVTAVRLNREYLRWRAGNTESKAWYSQPAKDAAVSAGPAPLTTPPVLGISESDYFAPSPPIQVSAPAPARKIIDVNSASAEDLVASLAIDASLAGRIAEARTQLGGFRDLDDLVTTAALQPHEMVRIRDKVEFGPFETKGGTAARPEQRGGRILDV